MNVLNKIRNIIDTINSFTGEIMKFSLIVIMCCLAFEVCSRYIFNSPTIWAQDISRQSLALAGAFGGAYAYLYNAHVRVDVFYSALSVRKQAIIDIVTSVLFVVFVGTIMIKSFEMAQDSWFFKEKMPTAFAPPLYYIKSVIPIASALLLLQGIGKLLHDIEAVITGESKGLRELNF